MIAFRQSPGPRHESCQFRAQLLITTACSRECLARLRPTRCCVLRALDANTTTFLTHRDEVDVDASALPATKFTRFTVARRAAPAITINDLGAPWNHGLYHGKLYGGYASAWLPPSTQTTTVNLLPRTVMALKRIPQSVTGVGQPARTSGIAWAVRATRIYAQGGERQPRRTRLAA